MKYHHQTQFHEDPTDPDKVGNCMQTAVACVLDKEIQDVPPIHRMMIDPDPRLWAATLQQWLVQQGYAWIGLAGHQGARPDEYYLVSGKSPRGDFNHVVIFQNGNMVHDPHPDNTGILTEEGFEVIYKFQSPL